MVIRVKRTDIMDIRNIQFEEKLVLTINNQTIEITPFLIKEEPGNIKLGIDAPYGVAVNREEIYKRKQAKRQSEPLHDTFIDYVTKIQVIFTALLNVMNKSEKLEAAASTLFHKDKIITPKTINAIATGESTTTRWIVTCAIDVLINEQPKTIKEILSPDELYLLWAKPLLNRTTENKTILSKAQQTNIPELIKQIINYSQASK